MCVCLLALKWLVAATYEEKTMMITKLTVVVWLFMRKFPALRAN